MSIGKTGSTTSTSIPATTPTIAPVEMPNVSRFGNLMARIGGMNSQDIIPAGDKGVMKFGSMTQEDLDKYMATRSASKNKGVSDLLMALGSAFKGEDIQGNVQNLREQRSLQEEQDRLLDLNQRMSQAYADGNYDLLNSLALESGDASSKQSIFNRINRDVDMSTVSSDGKLIFERDEQGNIISAKPNLSVIEAIDPKELSYSAIKDINENESNLASMDTTTDEIDGFIKMIDNKELDFGFTEGIGDYFRNENYFGMTSDQESRNSRAFTNWKNNLVNKALQMQPGTKTDFDFVAIAQSLASANDPEGVKQFLLDYKKGLAQERKAKIKAIDNIYELSGVDKPESDADMTFVTKE